MKILSPASVGLFFALFQQFYFKKLQNQRLILSFNNITSR